MTSPRLAPKQEAEIGNSLRVAEDLALRRRSWKGMPFHVEISTNNACNLDCVMCDRPDLTFINGDRLESLARTLFPAASVITPSATSEPAMGDFNWILDDCERYDLRLNLITNGNLITDRHIERLRGRLFRVDFSIDSHIPSVYEEIRVGGRHERMLAGLRRLVALQKEEHFQLSLVVVLMKQNLTTLAGTVSFARQEGIKRVRIQKLLPFFPEPHRFHVDEHFTPDEIRYHLDQAVATAQREDIDLTLDLESCESHLSDNPDTPALSPPVVLSSVFDAIQEANPNFCYQLASYIRIIPNGNVYPCCRGWGDTLLMGNIFKQPIEEIWNGPAYRKLREEFYTGDLNDRCRTCTLSGQGTL